MATELDGLVTFFASHHAIRAEKVLSKAGLHIRLIPGPKELSPNCGVALRIEFAARDTARAVLDKKKVQVDEIIQYRPRTDDWRSGPPRQARRRWFARRSTR